MRFSPAHLGAFAIIALIPAQPALAGTISEASKSSPQTGTVTVNDSGVFTSGASVLHNKQVSPPLSLDQVSGSSGASADARFGLLRSASSVQADLDISNAATQSGQVDNLHWASAQITDTLNWSGLSPLVLDLDVDWTFLFSTLQFNVAASDPGATASADLSLRVILTGFPNAAAYSRTFVYGDRQASVDDPQTPSVQIRSWRYVDGNGTVIEQGTTYPGTSFVRSVVLPSAGLPTAIGVTFDLGTGASCYLQPYLGQQHCVAQSIANSTGFLRITGDFTSQNGYSYPGRGSQPGSPVPEPSTVATVAGALAFLAARAWRR